MWANFKQILGRITFILLAVVSGAVSPALAQQPIPEAGAAQIRALLQDKANRTPAQLKLDSQIIYNARVAAGLPAAPGVTRSFHPGFLEKSTDNLIHVDIAADVTAELLAAIKGVGGRVESSFPEYKTVRAWIPLASAEALAGRSDVQFIKPAAIAHVNSARPVVNRSESARASIASQLLRALPALAMAQSGTAQVLPPAGPDTTGVTAHGAGMAQAAGITGSGIKVGVLSDGVTSLANEQAAGRLPTTVTVLSGQSGDGPGPCPGPKCPDEGTALLEVVYSMAPGASLFYATGDSGEAQFATNIKALQAAGCDIIVDDISYPDEPVFQDGTVAQAVDTVTAAGALYFSSAANSGNLDSGTSGTWEGDFSGDGAAPKITETGTVHSFGATDYDVLTSLSSFGEYGLQWSDAQGGSCNDYDLFILDPTGTVVELSSTNRQTCGQNPFEFVTDSTKTPAVAVNSRIVIVNENNGAARALHLDTERGRVSIGTSGASFGHNAAANALSVAASNVANASGGMFIGGFQDPPESFSSDGPRKIFYDPSGNAITTGNFLFGTNGGTTLAKVDFTAADGVPTGVPQFPTFFGTSAAAPHAAAIAALLMSANGSLTPAQVKSIMYSTSLPVSGFASRTVGTGIVMAALPPRLAKAFGAVLIRLHASTSLGFVVTNPNAEIPLSGIAFTDFLPSGLVVATPNGLTGTCGGGTILATAGSTSVSLTGAALPVSGSCTFSVNVTATSGGVKVNQTGPITAAGGGSGAVASAIVTVVVPPVITKAFGGGTVPINHSTSLTFAITNPNATVALTGVGFTDTLPAGLVVTTPNGLTGSCGAGAITAVAGSSSIALAGGTLAAGGSCAISVNATGTSAGIKNNATSTVSSIQGGAGAPAMASITVVLPPVISKAFAAQTILVGGSTALSFSILNPNTTVALTMVGFTDILPPGLVVSTPNGIAGSCGGGTITAVAGSTNISLTGATIPLETSCTFSVNVTGTTVGKKINTTSAVSSLEGATGNSATATITVLAPAAVDYFSNAHAAGALDGTVRLINPGTTGDQCDDIFVFDSFQEMTECCSCFTTPDDLLTLSVNRDLTGNPLIGKLVSTGSIVIIPVALIGGNCPVPTSLTSQPALREWGTHIQSGGSGFAVTEVEGQTAGLTAEQLTALTKQCTAITLVGSGSGICANSAALAGRCNN
jgi:hypothetical protein